MSRIFHFNGPVTYIEKNYEGVGHQHKVSGDSSEKKNDSSEVVFEQSVKVKCTSSAAAGKNSRRALSRQEWREGYIPDGEDGECLCELSQTASYLERAAFYF